MPTEKTLLKLSDAASRVSHSPQHLIGEWRLGRLALKEAGTPNRKRFVVMADEIDRWANELPDAVPDGRPAR